VTQVAILRHGEKSWILFPGKPLIIGSSTYCDLQIELHGIAKKHLKIGLLGDGSLHVRPLGGNRVEVEGMRIEQGTILPRESSLVFGLAHLQTEAAQAGFGLHLREALKENLNEAKKEIHKLPWFLASLTAHFLLIWLLLAIKTQSPSQEGDRARYKMEKISTLDSDEIKDNEEESIQSPKIVDPEPPSVSSDIPIFEPMETNEESPDSLATGGSNENETPSLFTPLFPSRGKGGRGKNLKGLSGALKKRISHLRLTGLEIALCLDSTSSMGETISQAKGNLKTIFLLLKDLVPSSRIALLAYRDKGDDYVVRKTRLGVNLWEGLSFLSSIQSEGGGDFPEALDEAMAQANRLPWKRNSTKVILLVGDAPPHEYMGLSRAIRLAKIFSNRNGSVHAMQVGTDQSTTLAFEKISKAGHGLRLSLGEDGSIESFSNLFLRLALGPTSEKDVPKMVAKWKKSNLKLWGRTRKKRSSLQLVSTLRSARPKPQIIETWAQFGKRSELRRLLPKLRRTRLSVEGRQALIYLVNSLFNREGFSPLGVKQSRDQVEIFSKMKRRLGR
jgi:hypothetical protein